ncbi:CNH domain-containing protein [Mycena galericulata]|nr:CNH domain-containing protein [Mycena galericulata]
MYFALPSPIRSRFRLFSKRSSPQRNGPPSSILPVATPAVSKAVKGEFPTEIYELIIDHLGPDKPSLYACMLVCRSWYPRSSYLFSGSMICRPVRLVGLPDSKKVTCAVPYKGNGGGILYGTADGIHRATEDGSDSRLFAIQDVSQIDILEGINLFLCLAGGELMSMPLDELMSGTATHTNRIPSWRASFFAQNTSTVAEGHRVCLVKSSSTSVTIKVLAVHINGEGIHTRPLLHSQDLWIPTTREACSVQFIAPLKLVVIHGGFDIIDLETLDSHRMPEPSERLLKFIRKRDKPMAVFRSLDTLLLCYHKFAFHADAGE